MKKCVRCNVVFHSEPRTRCLYCDSILMLTSERQDVWFDDKPLDVMHGITKFLKPTEHRELDRKQYILGSYFRSRTFGFMYGFCRTDLKIGKKYPRFFVRPIDMTSFLSFPWLFINVVDSLLFHAWNIGFCEKCQYKYRPQPGIVGHEEEECAYNREYLAIVQDIMSGRITQTEDMWRENGQLKIAQGKRSAYHELCSQRNKTDVFLDVAGIWLSVCVAIYLIVRFFSPMLLDLLKHMEQESKQNEVVI